MSRGQPSQDPVTTNSYDDNEIVNGSDNLHIEQIMRARLSRRQALKGGIGVTTAALLGSVGLAACGGGGGSSSSSMRSHV